MIGEVTLKKVKTALKMRTIPNIKDNPKNEDNLKIEDYPKNEDNTREFSFLKGLPTAVVFVALGHF